MRSTSWTGLVVAAVVVVAGASLPVRGQAQSVPQAAQADPEQQRSIAQAEAAAAAWLALVDAGDYASSWKQSAALFRDKVAQSTWEQTIGGARPPMGAVRSRKIKTARFERSLPGAPDGAYVVIEYTTEFEKKPGAGELVTPMREADGSWHVSGYFIR